ncbi:MAG TPA: RNA polymerase sigma factor region1.1 domain-containing protein, partial [Acidimicrobiia bacterium]
MAESEQVAKADAAPDTASGADASADDPLARFKDRGFVTSGEIFAAFPDLEPDTGELAAIYAGIKARGIEVVDEITEELQREDQRRAGGSAPASDTHRRRPAEPARPQPAVSRPGEAAEPRPKQRLGRLGEPAARPARATEFGSFDPVRMYLKEIGKV